MEVLEELHSSLIVNGALNGFLSCTAIVLNIITIQAMTKTSSLPIPLRTFLLSLAASDIGVGLLAQPLYIVYLVAKMQPNAAWENSPIFSYVYLISMDLFIYASFFGVMVLSANRFLAVHLHLRYQELVTHKRVFAVVISIWVLSAILSFIRLWTISMYLIFVIIEVVCVASATFFNYKIYLAVRRHKNEIQALQVQQVPQNSEIMAHNAERLRKSAISTFYVYLLFLVTYLPKSCIFVSVLIAGLSATIEV